MKLIYPIIALCFLACNEHVEKTKITEVPELTEPAVDSVIRNTPTADSIEVVSYSNARFRNVIVEKTEGNIYSITGEAQIFEANFNWVIEDGHNELQKGFQMTDAGAPEWGAFSFTVTAEKQRPNSTLLLILFESSAKDGSRQHELPITLE